MLCVCGWVGVHMSEHSGIQGLFVPLKGKEAGTNLHGNTTGPLSHAGPHTL